MQTVIVAVYSICAVACAVVASIGVFRYGKTVLSRPDQDVPPLSFLGRMTGYGFLISFGSFSGFVGLTEPAEITPLKLFVLACLVLPGMMIMSLFALFYIKAFRKLYLRRW